MKKQYVGQGSFLSKNILFDNKLGSIHFIVFGCGYGESILLKTDSGKIIIVDSFINRDTKNPIAIDYLNFCKIDLKNISCVVATHFDDDHIKGISKILELTDYKVPIVINPILMHTKRELIINSIALNNQINSIEDNKTSEIVKIFNILQKNKNLIINAQCGKTIYSDPDSECFSIESLSPHDDELTELFLRLAEPEFDFVKNYKRLENLFSLVLLVKTTYGSLLLGGDCICTNYANQGWSRICNDYSKRTKSDLLKSRVFKVPHHGSRTAQNDMVWHLMLDQNPLTVSTVYNKKSIVPNDEEVEWLLNKTDAVFVVGCSQKNDELTQKIKKITGRTENVYFIDGKNGLLLYSFNALATSLFFDGYVQKYFKEEGAHN